MFCRPRFEFEAGGSVGALHDHLEGDSSSGEPRGPPAKLVSGAGCATVLSRSTGIVGGTVGVDRR